MNGFVETLVAIEHRLLSNAKRAHASLLAFFTVLYLLTIHPGAGGVTNMGDSAKFQFLGPIAGVSHPPGNPLYLIANAAMAMIPLPATAAWKANLLSAIFGVATLSFVFRMMLLVTTNPQSPEDTWPIGSLRTAVLGTVLLGIGPLFWSLATEAEVYTLSTLFSSMAMLGFVRWLLVKDERALALGLCAWLVGFGNHLSIVSLTPAILWLLWSTRSEMRHPLRTFALATLGAMIGAGSYGYIYLRAKALPAYSEFPQPMTVQHFIDFVTAKQFQSGFGRFSIIEAMKDRFPVLFAQLQKQWIWPLLLLLPYGLVRLFRSSLTLFQFIGLATLGQFVFAFMYKIPDPEGFFMPVLPVIALLLAAGISSINESEFRMRLYALAAIGVLVFATARFVEFWYRSGDDLTLDTREGRVAVIFPSVFQSLPEGAIFAVPCGHYGCVELTNYFRLADETVKAKRITFGRFPWSEWDDELVKVPIVDPFVARTNTICTVLKEDVKKLKEKNVPVKKLDRIPYTRHLREFKGAPIYCTAMGGEVQDP